jgi:hypothetical protein
MKKRNDKKCVVRIDNKYIAGAGSEICLVEDLQNARVFASHGAAKTAIGVYDFDLLLYKLKLSEDDVVISDITITETSDIYLYNKYYGSY